MSNGKLCDPNSCSLVGKLQLKSDRWKTRAEQAEAREKVLRDKIIACVQKVRNGLGAGGRSTGMYLEIELGNAICDALTDAIEEEFAGEGK